MPAIARWPGVVPAGKTTSQAAITIDWTATIVSLASGKADPQYPLDGEDLMPVLRGAEPHDRTLFWRLRTQDAARMGKWKYLREGTTEHLFDLSVDPGKKPS